MSSNDGDSGGVFRRRIGRLTVGVGIGRRNGLAWELQRLSGRWVGGRGLTLWTPLGRAWWFVQAKDGGW